MSQESELREVLIEFCGDIAATGGLDAVNDGLACDPEWLDLADTYVRACKVLGLTPVKS